MVQSPIPLSAMTMQQLNNALRTISSAQAFLEIGP
jgi:hypothetical protein